MKKILTLFTMLLVTVSTLLAQAPSLNYQMIVRNQTTEDVTLGGKVFHPNDLIYNTTLAPDVYILHRVANAASYAEVSYPQMSATTNMNGMLTISLNDPDDGDYSFKAINWADAKIVVKIQALGINDTMEILPVPYALTALRDSAITTPRIVKYIKGANADDIATIDTAITIPANNAFINALRDSVANAMKRHPGTVKQLAIYFLGTVNATDVVSAVNAIPQDVVELVKDTIVKYAKNHREEALNLAKYFIGQTTVEDVSRLWDSAMNRQGAYEIVQLVVDSVNDYIARHPELATKTAKYVVAHLSAEDVFALQNYTKANNPAAYDYAKGILNSLIDDYMEDNGYQKNQCNGKPIDLCTLQAEINQYAQYRDVECPSFGTTSFNQTNLKLTTPINATDFTLAEGEHYWYMISFPNSVYPDTVVKATLNQTETNPLIEANIPSVYAKRKMNIVPKMEQPCKDLATYGDTLNYVCQECECPAIASFSYTSTAIGDLSTYEGVQLRAKLTNSYSADKYGFVVSTDGVHWDTLKVNPAFGIDGLTFVDTIKMNYCDKQIKVHAYVICGDNSSESTDGEFRLRELRLEVAQASENPAKLIATNGIHISTEAYYNDFGTYWPSVEQIVAKYGATVGDVHIDYEWFKLDNGQYVPVEGSNNTYSPYANGEHYKVTCSFSIFNSEPCVLEATYPVQ